MSIEEAESRHAPIRLPDDELLFFFRFRFFLFLRSRHVSSKRNDAERRGQAGRFGYYYPGYGFNHADRRGHHTICRTEGLRGGDLPRLDECDGASANTVTLRRVGDARARSDRGPARVGDRRKYGDDSRSSPVGTPRHRVEHCLATAGRLPIR